MATTPVLSTTRYVEIGTYIGQYFLPGAGNLPNDVRVPCLVGKGDRHIMIKNTTMRRSFITGEQLSFSTIAPFIAITNYPSDGTQSAPVSLFTSGGVEVQANRWEWLADMSGNFTQIHIADNAFDPLAQYSVNYQSTSRDVVDVIPQITIQNLTATVQVREVTAVGSIQDLSEYHEYRDFYITFEIDPVDAESTNLHLAHSFSAVVTDASNTGHGVITVANGAGYTHNYDRLYTFEVMTATGTTPNRSATIAWSASPVSMGNAALPPTPLNAVQARPVITLTEGGIITNQLLELGVVMDFAFGAANYAPGDKFYMQARGPGMIELDPKISNTNQFTTISPVSKTAMTGSTGTVAVTSLTTAYALVDHNVNVRMEVSSITGTGASRTATIVWSAYGTTLVSSADCWFTTIASSSTTLVQTLGASGLTVTLSFGATHFVAGDRFDFQVKAPRVFYQGKESIRNLTLSVGSVVNSVDKAIVHGGYLSDTPEGKFGAWVADTTINQGRFDLPDALSFYVRNAYLSSLIAPPGGSQLAAGDKFSTQCRSIGTIDFSLLTEFTQTIANPSQVATDIAGTVTGTVGARYFILDYTPVNIVSVKRAVASTTVSYSQIAGTPLIVITEPTFGIVDGDLQVVYQHQGAEPTPGQNYYLSAKYLRPDAFYNQPILFLTKGDTAAFLSPSTTKNDLAIGANICWDYSIPGLFCIQVKDLDDDGVYSKDDYRTATNAFMQDKRATDLVVLNFFAALPDQLQVVNRSSDPFELHECLTFVGAPIGTTIGSEQQVGSLIFLSRKTLSVYGQNPAHGTRILVGSTRATRTIVLDNKTSTSVTLDGSFVAASLAALNCSFTMPTETVLLKAITSFDTMQTYRQEENLQLGGAQIIYFKDEGFGVYRIYEDVTTDTFSPDTKNLNQMTQKQFVTRDIRRTVNGAIIGLVFPSAGAGTAALKSTLVDRLSSLETGGFIGRFQTATGQDRALDTAADITVFRDTIDPTLFHIGYNYFLATVAKRVFGLYTVSLPGGFPQ